MFTSNEFRNGFFIGNQLVKLYDYNKYILIYDYSNAGKRGKVCTSYHLHYTNDKTWFECMPLFDNARQTNNIDIDKLATLTDIKIKSYSEKASDVCHPKDEIDIIVNGKYDLHVTPKDFCFTDRSCRYNHRIMNYHNTKKSDLKKVYEIIKSNLDFIKSDDCNFRLLTDLIPSGCLYDSYYPDI